MSLSFKIVHFSATTGTSGSGLPILPGSAAKEKLKFLIAGIDLFNKQVVKMRLRYDNGFVPIMRMSGFLLLPAGWLLVLAALAMLPPGMARNAFVIAGLALEATGLVLVVRSHRAGRES